MSSPSHARSPGGRGPGWPLLLVLAAGMAAVAATLFAVTTPFSSSDETESTRYVEAVVGAPSRVNPLFAYMNEVDRDLVTLVYSGLTRLGPGGEVLPDLAESWETSPDGKIITFHLRRNVKWHTGTAVSADDVLFTYALLANRNFEGDPEQAALWRELKCTAPDALTVACELPEAFAPFLSYASIGILPAYILNAPEVAATLAGDPFNRAPIGTGPYRVEELDDTHAMLKANDEYHLGRPQIDEIELRFYPDSTTAAAELIRKEVDGFLVDQSANQDDFEALTSLQGVRSYSLNRSAYTVLYLNNTEPPLTEKAVRTAIARTIDVNAIISDIMGGRAVRAESPIVPGTWAFNPQIRPVTRDVGAARKLLEEAGWVLPEGASVRQKDQLELRISLMTDQDPFRGAIADAIKDQLADIGIDVSVVKQGSTNLVREYLIPREYQAAIFGWDPGPDPDPYPAWHSSQAIGNGRNLAAYANTLADQLMEKARQTFNVDERQRLYYQFQDIFLDDLPSVLLFYPVYTYFVTGEIKQIQPGTLFYPASRFNNVQQWMFEKVPDISEE